MEEMRAIAQTAEQVGALVVRNEVFCLITLDGAAASSFMDRVEQSMVLGDMTEPWGLGELRVGWIASRNQALLKCVGEARDYSNRCGSTPSEFLAEVALRQTQRITASRLATGSFNRQRLADAIMGGQRILH